MKGSNFKFRAQIKGFEAKNMLFSVLQVETEICSSQNLFLQAQSKFMQNLGISGRD